MPSVKVVGISSARLAALLLLLMSVLAWRPQSAAAEVRLFTFIEADELEYRVGNGQDTFWWDAQAWVGKEYDKIWFKTRGEDTINGGATRAELQLLYSWTVSAFWDLQAGVRYDVKPNPSRGYAVVGVQGLAPYWFDVDAAAFVSDHGDLAARILAESDLLLTQRLIARLSVELNAAAQDVEELGIGSGLSDVELELRLRYEIMREFAPYIGVSWERKIGPTADVARRQGMDVEGLMWVSGVRCWF